MRGHAVELIADPAGASPTGVPRIPILFLQGLAEVFRNALFLVEEER